MKRVFFTFLLLYGTVLNAVNARSEADRRALGGALLAINADIRNCEQRIEFLEDAIRRTLEQQEADREDVSQELARLEANCNFLLAARNNDRELQIENYWRVGRHERLFGSLMYVVSRQQQRIAEQADQMRQLRQAIESLDRALGLMRRRQETRAE